MNLGASFLALDHPLVGRTLLKHMHQLVAQQPPAGVGVWGVLARTEDDVRSHGICQRIDAAGRLGRAGITMNPDGAEVGTESGLHVGPGGSVEWLTSRP